MLKKKQAVQHLFFIFCIVLKFLRTMFLEGSKNFYPSFYLTSNFNSYDPAVTDQEGFFYLFFLYYRIILRIIPSNSSIASSPSSSFTALRTHPLAWVDKI